MVNSGADDLLLRPFSTALLGSRIEAHIERRKGFVITTDYVGPDRRKRRQARRSNAEMFDPPNSLKMKAKEKLTADAIAKRLDAELKAARDKLNSEKLRRDSFQVCILWRLMQEQRPGAPAGAGGSGKAARADPLDRRGAAAKPSIDAAVEWCDSVPARPPKGWSGGGPQRLDASAGPCRAQPAPDLPSRRKSPADQLTEIDATVAIIRARSQTAMAS